MGNPLLSDYVHITVPLFFKENAVNPVASTLQIYDEPDDSKRLRAWEAHYRAKGCSEWKAQEVARKRCWRKGGWPNTLSR